MNHSVKKLELSHGLDLSLLFNHFNKLLDAPKGIQKMRELILQLAVQGKLVPQDPNDEPASELLKRIKAEKQKLIAEGKIRKDKPLPPIKPEDIPYELPNWWAWCRLGEVGNWGAGSTPNRKNTDYYNGNISWFKSGELNDNQNLSKSKEHITDLALEKYSLRYNNPGDVLIAMYGATIGKLAILSIHATTNQAVCACTCFSGIYNVFLFNLLLSWRIKFTGQGAGGAQPNISKIKIINTIVPLPPLNEQHRIVAKVNQLMALCDELEKLKEKRDRKQLLMNKAALFALLNSQTLEEFAEHWQRIVDHFDEFYRIPENVAELKKAILQLAVQGKLVPQDESDESAVELLKKIKAEKQKLIAEGKIKKDKPLPPIKPEEIPYELPKGWVWCRLKELGQANPRNDVDDEVEVSFIPMALISEQYGRPPKSEKRLWLEIKKGFTHFKDDDVVVAKITPCFQNGKSAIMKNLYNGSGAGTTELHVFRGNPELVLPEYIYIFFKSPRFLEEGVNNMTGTAGQQRVPKQYVFDSPFPLPPINEQHRIVAKVDELMRLCDELEKGLTQSHESLGKALGSVVSGVGNN